MITGVSLFLGLPLIFMTIEDVPVRTPLKETISIIILAAFFMMMAQFYLSRVNRKLLAEHKASRVNKLHKIIGFIFVPLLLIHPFMVVVPRYFEAGPEPMDAFLQILENSRQTGVLLGIIAWSLMLLLGLTSFFRRKLGIQYRTWRILHGVLSSIFIVLASWHAIDLGRHTGTLMSAYIIILAGGGIILLLQAYLFPKPIHYD